MENSEAEFDDKCMTFLVAAKKKDSHPGNWQVVIFGSQENDGFIGLSVEYEAQDGNLAKVTKADFHAFQGAQIDNMETWKGIVGTIKLNIDEAESLIGQIAPIYDE